MRNLAQVTCKARSHPLGPSSIERAAPMLARGIFQDHAAAQNAVLQEVSAILEKGEASQGEPCSMNPIVVFQHRKTSSCRTEA